MDNVWPVESVAPNVMASRETKEPILRAKQKKTGHGTAEHLTRCSGGSPSPLPLVRGKPNIGRGAALQATSFFVPRGFPNNRDDETLNRTRHAEAKTMPKNAKLAMIIEALLLGFSASAARKAANK